MGGDALPLDDPLVATVFSQATTFCPAPPNVKQMFLVLVMKLNTQVLQMSQLKHAGYVSYFMNYTHLLPRKLLFIAIISVLCTCLPIRFSINVRDIQIWIFTLYVTRLPRVTYVFFMFLLVFYMSIFSPKDFQHPFSQSSDPVLMFSLDLPLNIYKKNVYKFVFIKKCTQTQIFEYAFSLLYVFFQNLPTTRRRFGKYQ